MLWDLNEGKHLYSLEAGDIVNALVFSPNRYWLCAATSTCIKIFDLESKCVTVPISPLVRMESSPDFLSGPSLTSSSPTLLKTPARVSPSVFPSPGRQMVKPSSVVLPMTSSVSGLSSHKQPLWVAGRRGAEGRGFCFLLTSHSYSSCLLCCTAFLPLLITSKSKASRLRFVSCV